MVKLFLAAIAVCAFNVSAFADCGGASFATPIRSLIAPRPIQSTLQKIQASAQANRAARATGCSGERAASCSGPQVVAPSCTQKPQYRKRPHRVRIATQQNRHRFRYARTVVAILFGT